jgi:hypothetical protein
VLLYQGNLQPEFTTVLTDEDGLPLDLSTATGVEVIGRIDGEIVVDHDLVDAGVVVDNAGNLTLIWSGSDTAALGLMTLEVLITWPDGPQTIVLDEYVEVAAPGPAALVTIEDLINHMSGISLTPAQRTAGEVIVAGCIRGLERKLYRRFVVGQTTAVVSGDELGWAPLENTPVRTLVSVDGSTDPDVLAAYMLSPNGIWVGIGPSVTVVYTGGYATDVEEYADVRLAILEKCAGVMTTRHDDTLSVKELDTRDDVETARKAAATWSDEDIEPFSRLRRRVVV